MRNDPMSVTCRIVLAALLSLAPTALTAQQCMGRASFAARRAQISADADFSSGARSVSGGVSIGSPAGPFASVGLGTAYDDTVDDNARIFGATAGLALPFRPKPKTQFCPFISALVVDGVEFDTGERLSSEAFGFGVRVGRTATLARRLEIIPFAGAAVITQTTTIEFGATAAETELLYAISLGAGFVLGKVFTIRPSATMAVANARTSMSYGLHASFSFGRVVVRPRPSEGEGSLTTVWVNTRAGVYYCPGSNSYGATPYGTFMTERQALANGAAPVSGRRCQ